MIGALIGGAIGGFIGGAIGSSGGDDGTHYHYYAPPKVDHKLLANEIVNAIVEKNEAIKAHELYKAKEREILDRKTCALCGEEIKIEEVGFCLKSFGYEFYCEIKCKCHKEVIDKNICGTVDPLVSHLLYNTERMIDGDYRSSSEARRAYIWNDYLFNSGMRYKEFSDAMHRFYTIYDDDEHNKRQHPLEKVRAKFENRPAICLTIEQTPQKLT